LTGDGSVCQRKCSFYERADPAEWQPITGPGNGCASLPAHLSTTDSINMQIEGSVISIRHSAGWRGHEALAVPRSVAIDAAKWLLDGSSFQVPLFHLDEAIGLRFHAPSSLPMRIKAPTSKRIGKTIK